MNLCLLSDGYRFELYWNRNVLESLELCRQKLKTWTKKWKQKWKLAFFSINTSHQTEYLESISQSSKLHVQLHSTDSDHHITNILKSPQRVNTEVILPVLNFSGSVYQIKIGKLRGIQSHNNVFCVFCLGSHCCLMRPCVFPVLCYVWQPSMDLFPTLAELKWDNLP